MAFSRKEHSNWLSTNKQSAMKTYLQVALYGLNKLYLGHTYISKIYVYTFHWCVCVCLYVNRFLANEVVMRVEFEEVHEG